MSKSWVAPIYVFFRPTPTVEYVKGRKAHVFHCGAAKCRGRTDEVWRYLDTDDVSSTSNLRRHAKKCWGEDSVDAADGTEDVDTARAALASHKKLDGSITSMFRRISKGKVTYSHHQHTKLQSRCVDIILSGLTIG